MITDQNITIYNGGGGKFYRKTVKINYRFAKFARISFKDSDLSNTKFTQCRFEDCYFRNADLTKAILVGSKFKECTFKNTNFKDTNLKNVIFDKCVMDELQAFTNCKKDEFHATSRLASNLKLNAPQYKKKKISLLLLNYEKEYLRKHHKAYIKRDLKHYRDNYTKSKYWRAIRYLICDFLDKSIWGYGYDYIALFNSASFVIILFTLFIFIFSSLPICESLIISIASFSTLGFINSGIKIDNFINSVMVIESLSGAIFIAILASVIYNRFNKFN